MPDDRSQAVSWVWGSTEGNRSRAKTPRTGQGDVSDRDIESDHRARGSQAGTSIEAGPRRRLLTDGGRDTELPVRESPAFGSGGREDDPFVWEGEEAVQENDAAPSAGDATGDDAGDEQEAHLELPPEEPGAADEAADADQKGIDDDATAGECTEVAECVERLSELAEDINLKAINASLKHARNEDDDLETIHDELEIYADRLTREIEELEAAIEDVQESTRRWRPTSWAGLASIPGLRRGRARGRPVRSRPPAVPPIDSPDRTVTPGDDPQSDETVPVKTNGADVNGHAGENVSSIEPLDFLIPGVQLRDMWRAGEVEYTNTSRDAEWWVLETTSRSVDEPPEFPPEVTEFALDPDEVSFDDLVEDVIDDS